MSRAEALMIAAPGSGSGKTVLTLGLLRAFAQLGEPMRGAKSGPDYIDPRFHEAASGVASVNLDAFAMSPDLCRRLASAAPSPVLIEAAMGLYDGAPPDGQGSAADLARVLGCPVVLVIDAGRMAQSARALLRGFCSEPDAPPIAGVILNNLGSARHEALLRAALDQPDLPPIFGAMPRSAALHLPARHLGLVQAEETEGLPDFLDGAAALIRAHIDLDRLRACFAPLPDTTSPRLRPPAQRIAIARDEAFAFTYPHLLEDWHARGCEIKFFSPLADEAAPAADMIFLPGGYPELHAGRLAAAQNFMQNIKSAAQVSDIYGECGGYMLLGDGIEDAHGARHRMLGLLRLETSFAKRRLHLGYRRVTMCHGPFAGAWTGHEFHYASTMRAKGAPLLQASDAEGRDLGPMGLRAGRVCGSFIHLIAPQ